MVIHRVHSTYDYDDKLHIPKSFSVSSAQKLCMRASPPAVIVDRPSTGHHAPESNSSIVGMIVERRHDKTRHQ